MMKMIKNKKFIISFLLFLGAIICIGVYGNNKSNVEWELLGTGGYDIPKYSYEVIDSNVVVVKMPLSTKIKKINNHNGKTTIKFVDTRGLGGIGSNAFLIRIHKLEGEIEIKYRDYKFEKIEKE